ncbi:hypothetical protein UlMin_024717 [Ulmus minor]
MGLISNEISPDMLQPGDHIYAYRMVHIYSHHGIYVGNDRVIHYNGPDPEKIQSVSGSNYTRCGKCGYLPTSKSQGVVISCLDCFLNGHRLFRFEYEASSLQFLVQTSGSCSTRPCDKPEVVVQRATDLLNKGFGNYDLFKNNCESFAFYCKTGKAESYQATVVDNFNRVMNTGSRGIPGVERVRLLTIPQAIANGISLLLWTPKFLALKKDANGRR